MRTQRTHLHLVLLTSAHHGIASSSAYESMFSPMNSALSAETELRAIHLRWFLVLTAFCIEPYLTHERRQEGLEPHRLRFNLFYLLPLVDDYMSKRRTGSVSWGSDATKSRVVPIRHGTGNVSPAAMGPSSVAHVPSSRNRTLKLEFNPLSPKNVAQIHPRQCNLPSRLAQLDLAHL